MNLGPTAQWLTKEIRRSSRAAVWLAFNCYNVTKAFFYDGDESCHRIHPPKSTEVKKSMEPIKTRAKETVSIKPVKLMNSIQDRRRREIRPP